MTKITKENIPNAEKEKIFEQVKVRINKKGCV